MLGAVGSLLAEVAAIAAEGPIVTARAGAEVGEIEDGIGDGIAFVFQRDGEGEAFGMMEEAYDHAAAREMAAGGSIKTRNSRSAMGASWFSMAARFRMARRVLTR